MSAEPMTLEQRLTRVETKLAQVEAQLLAMAEPTEWLGTLRISRGKGETEAMRAERLALCAELGLPPDADLALEARRMMRERGVDENGTEFSDALVAMREE